MLVGDEVCQRFRSVRAEEGTQVAARRLRRYGFTSPQSALRILGIVPTPSSASGRTAPAVVPGEHALSEAIPASGGREPGRL